MGVLQPLSLKMVYCVSPNKLLFCFYFQDPDTRSSVIKQLDFSPSRESETPGADKVSCPNFSFLADFDWSNRFLVEWLLLVITAFIRHFQGPIVCNFATHDLTGDTIFEWLEFLSKLRPRNLKKYLKKPKKYHKK